MTNGNDKSRSTILVVEDNEAVLDLVQSILKNDGFRVLQATSPDAAVKLTSEYPDQIALLVSAVEMPGSTGPELGIRIKKFRPDIRVMLISGLRDGGLLVLDHTWAFIEKPFVPRKLLKMVYQILEDPNISPHSYGYDTAEFGYIENPASNWQRPR